MNRWEKAAHSHRRVFMLPSQLGSTQLLCPVAFLIEFLFLFSVPLLTKNSKSERYRGSLMARFKCCMSSVMHKRKAYWPIAERKVFWVNLTEWWGGQPCSLVPFLSPGLLYTETWSSFVPQLVYCSWVGKQGLKEKMLQPHIGEMASVYAGMSEAFLEV